MGIFTGRSDPPHPLVNDSVSLRRSTYKPAWRNVWLLRYWLMSCLNSTQLIFCIAFYLFCYKRTNSTQMLTVSINSPTTKNVYTETTKYLLLGLDREYKQWASIRSSGKAKLSLHAQTRQGIFHDDMFKSSLLTRESPCKGKQVVLEFATILEKSLFESQCDESVFITRRNIYSYFALGKVKCIWFRWVELTDACVTCKTCTAT